MELESYRRRYPCTYARVSGILMMMATGVDNRLVSLSLSLSLSHTFSLLLSFSFYLPPLFTEAVEWIKLVDQTVITTNVNYILMTPSDTPRTSTIGYYRIIGYLYPNAYIHVLPPFLLLLSLS